MFQVFFRPCSGNSGQGYGTTETPVSKAYSINGPHIPQWPLHPNCWRITSSESTLCCFAHSSTSLIERFSHRQWVTGIQINLCISVSLAGCGIRANFRGLKPTLAATRSQSGILEFTLKKTHNFFGPTTTNLLKESFESVMIDSSNP